MGCNARKTKTICVHKELINFAGQLLSACSSVMLPKNFVAPELKEIAVLDFPSNPLRSSFIGDATVRGEGRLLY